MAIIISGLAYSFTPLTISMVSMPVTPSTPGATEHTERTVPGRASGMYSVT